MSLDPIAQAPKSGNERFHSAGEPLGVRVIDFWRWSASGFLGNAQRGVLAEFLVAHALGVAEGLRTGWEPFDLKTREGVRVEVKSSAYVQEWYQQTHSRISFQIKSARAWDPTTNVMEAESRRQSDVYVFCVLHHKEETVDPMDLAHWTFYVCSTATLDHACPGQKTIGLSRLLAIGAVETEYARLADAVRQSASESELPA